MKKRFFLNIHLQILSDLKLLFWIYKAYASFMNQILFTMILLNTHFDHNYGHKAHMPNRSYMACFIVGDQSLHLKALFKIAFYK